MRDFFERYKPVFSPDPPAAPPAAPAPAPASPPAAGPSGGDPQPPASPPAAGDPPVAPPAAGPYRPEGLPDTMFGKDDRETMDKMAGALKGYRERDSAVGKDAEAYKAFDFDKMDATLKPHMEGLSKDPIMDAAAKYAHDNKMPVPLVQGLIATVYGEAVKQGVFEGFVDVNAERAELLPEAAKTLSPERQAEAIDARMQANEDFVRLLTQGEGALAKEDADHALLMLMDTGKGNRFLEFVKGRITGADRAQPHGGGDGGGSVETKRAQLRAEMAKPEMNPQHPKFDRAAYDALDAEYQKLIPEK